MMKKLFVICAWTLLLGGCESDSGNAPGDVPPPSVDPVSPELKQKIEDLNAGLVTLRELTGAVSRSAVGAVTEGDAGTLIAFRDGTKVTVACDAEAAAANPMTFYNNTVGPVDRNCGRRGGLLLDARRGKGCAVAERRLGCADARLGGRSGDGC